MNKYRCWLNGIYLTLRYWKKHTMFYGHHFNHTGEVWMDYFQMKCDCCGKEAYAEVGPDGLWEEL